jgi:hypothetical protein
MTDQKVSRPSGDHPSRSAVPDLERPSYCKPHEFLLLSSYCGEDNPACSDRRPCADCLAMNNVFGGAGNYLRMLGEAPAIATEARRAETEEATNAKS